MKENCTTSHWIECETAGPFFGGSQIKECKLVYGLENTLHVSHRSILRYELKDERG